MTGVECARDLVKVVALLTSYRDIVMIETPVQWIHATWELTPKMETVPMCPLHAIPPMPVPCLSATPPKMENARRLQEPAMTTMHVPKIPATPQKVANTFPSAVMMATPVLKTLVIL